MSHSLPAPATLVLLSLALGACTPLPRIGTEGAAGTGAPPALVPLDGILAASDAAAAASADPAPGLAARAAALRARAAAMRGPVTDPATRARLAQAAG